jgi:hypothetical protein
MTPSVVCAGNRRSALMLKLSIQVCLWQIGTMIKWEKTYRIWGIANFLYSWWVRRRQIRLCCAYSKTESRWDIKDFLAFIKNQNQLSKCKMVKLFILSDRKLRIPVDKEAIIKKGRSSKYYDSIVPLHWYWNQGRTLYKNRLMMLDILANNDWKSQSVLVPVLLIQDYLWMKDYLQLDGIVFKLVP